jgi:glycosyltransferase involved in cell wall biosynthesis
MHVSLEVMSADLTIIILTYNESKHLTRCLQSIQYLAKRIVVVDCYSTDDTVNLAKSAGAEVLRNDWVNHSVQVNWALDNISIDTQWVMRLDADEVVTPELADALLLELQVMPEDVVGLTVNRQIHFLGRWIKHGGIYPLRMLRLWRKGYARCENRWMDEHMVVQQGRTYHIDSDIADINLNSLTWWTDKHNRYASREAVDLLMHKNRKFIDNMDLSLNTQARTKRWIKLKIYSRLPISTRSLLYFFYRYVFRLGFLDGWQGLVFHVLQGFWYRFLVDVKVAEVKCFMMENGTSLNEAMEQVLDIKVSKAP